MVKCPACGCETPDSAQWCGFCKEPFRKASRPASAGPSPAAQIKAEDPWTAIPPEFRALDTGGNIPALPAWCRYAAWAAFGAWIIAMMTLLGFYLAQQP